MKILNNLDNLDRISDGDIYKKVSSTEKNTWNEKQDKLITQTAYSTKGSATKVPQITTNTLGQVTNIDEVTITQPTKTSDLTNDSGFITNTDYATQNVGGVIKTSNGLNINNGLTFCEEYTYQQYQNNLYSNYFISKGTLENVISGKNIVKGSSTGYTIWNGTQAQYNAITTKDSKTIYIIVG